MTRWPLIFPVHIEDVLHTERFAEFQVTRQLEKLTRKMTPHVEHMLELREAERDTARLASDKAIDTLDDDAAVECRAFVALCRMRAAEHRAQLASTLATTAQTRAERAARTAAAAAAKVPTP